MKMIIEDAKHAITQRNRFRELYRKKAFCDLHLRASDGTLFRTHKLILATYSSYFRRFVSRKKQVTDVVNLDVDSCILSVLLDYIYRGQFEVEDCTRVRVQKAAQSLELEDVLQLLDKQNDQHELGTSNEGQTLPVLNKKKVTSRDGRVRKSKQKDCVRSQVVFSEKRGDETNHSKRKSGARGVPKVSEKYEEDVPGANRNRKRKSGSESRTYKKDTNKMEVSSNTPFHKYSAHKNLREPVVEIDMDAAEKDDVEENKAGIWQNLCVSENAYPHRHVSEELETKFMPLELKSEFIGTVQSLIEASATSTPQHSNTNMKANSYAEHSSDYPVRNTDNIHHDDEEDYGPQDEICRPVKCSSKDQSSTLLSTQVVSKKKTAHVRLMNIKNLHVMKMIKSERKQLNSTVSRQIVKKYCLFLNAGYGIEMESDTNEKNGESHFFVPLHQKKHICKICHKSFTLLSLCRAHVFRKHQKKKKKWQQKLKKLKCASTTKIIRARDSRTVESRPKQKREPKSRSFRSKLKVEKPLESFSEERTCTECGAVRANRRSLLCHLRDFHKYSTEEINNHESLLVHCEVKGCDFAAMMMKQVEKHVRTVHPEVEHKCPLCSYTFHLSTVLEKHMYLKHYHPEKLKYGCSFCEKRFSKLRMQKIHEQAKHGVDHGMNKYKCTEEGCHFSTASMTSLKAHAYVHKDKHFTCPYCSMKLKTETSLQRHLNKVHLGIRPFLCQMCGQSFGDVHNLRCHIGNKHTTDKDFKCSYCSYMTNTKSQFKMHVFRKHGVKLDQNKEYACPYCPYKALMKSRLLLHVNKHTNTRNYACDECGKTFVNGDTLRGHKEWIHSTAKYSCTYCPYITKTEKRLTQHISIQHKFKGMKPYQCPYCPFTCATGGNTRKHVMKRHPGMEVRYVKNMEMLNYMNEVKKKETSDLVSKAAESFSALM